MTEIYEINGNGRGSIINSRDQFIARLDSRVKELSCSVDHLGRTCRHQMWAIGLLTIAVITLAVTLVVR